MKSRSFGGIPIAWASAWTPGQVREETAQLLGEVGGLPSNREAPLLIKVDLGEGLPGPGGHCTDFRLLVAVVQHLKALGYSRLLVGDSLPSPGEGPAPSLNRRSRVDRLARWLGVPLMDLTRSTHVPVSVGEGSVRVCSHAFAGGVVVLPTFRVDQDLGLAGALASLVGLVHPDDRPLLRESFPEALLALERGLGSVVVLGSALVVREGEHPPTLSPRRFGRLVAGRDPLALDLFVARLLGMTPEEVPALWQALARARLSGACLTEMEDTLSVQCDVHKPVRPLTDRPRSRPPTPPRRWWWSRRAPALVAEDTLGLLERRPSRCQDCHRCEEFCPVGLSREQIGLSPAHDACVGCLYCYLACPRDALSLQGEAGPLAELLRLEKPAIERL